MDSKSLSIYIERIRLARNISQLTLVEDVVSIRQYRRYLNGNSDMPLDIFLQLIIRLGLQPDRVLREMENVRVKEYQYMNHLYNAAVNYDYKKFDTLYNNMPFTQFVDKSNEQLFKFSVVIKKYYQKIYRRDETQKMVEKIVNYPNILKNEVLTDIELLILAFLIDVSNKTTREKVVERIFYIYENKGIISSGNSRILIVIAAKLAKHFGILGEYDRVLDFCDIGINRNKTYESYYLSEYFYYYKSLAYHKLNQIDEFNIALQKCFNILEFDGNESKKKKFEDLIKDDYHFDFNQYVLTQYRKKFNTKKGKSN